MMNFAINRLAKPWSNESAKLEKNKILISAKYEGQS